MNVDISNEFAVNPFIKIDHVQLKVTSLKNSVDFYQSLLGFSVLESNSDGNTAFLGPSELKDKKSSTLLVLNQINNGSNNEFDLRNRREAGLYHFAILLPEREYLGSFLNHVRSDLDPKFYEGMADHGVSESIYLHDPDHNGIEVYSDRNPSEWKWVGKNKISMVTEPLVVDNLLEEDDHQKWNGFPAQTSIGHVHLNVSNLSKAMKFYHNTLGLFHTASYSGVYFFAGNDYHHHVATNIWIGTNLLHNSANDLTKPGLEYYAIRVTDNKDSLNGLRSRLTKNGIPIEKIMTNSREQQSDSFYIYDFDGIKIKILLNK